MKGSEKQIMWAEDIKSECQDILESVKREKYNKHGCIPKELILEAFYLNMLGKIDESKIWIDYRGELLSLNFKTTFDRLCKKGVFTDNDKKKSSEFLKEYKRNYLKKEENVACA